MLPLRLLKILKVYSGMKTTTPKPKQTKKPQTSLKRIALITVIAVLVIVTVGRFVLIPFTKPNSSSLDQVNEPVFRKDGEVRFFALPQKELQQKISIELADEESERQQGLMYRRTMESLQGMLFIFEDEDYRGFWMKNTPLSLDIIYVDGQLHIVSISQHTVPFSEETLPSGAPAKYVVEVNAGFCEQYAIEPGDSIAFQLY